MKISESPIAKLTYLNLVLSNTALDLEHPPSMAHFSLQEV